MSQAVRPNGALLADPLGRLHGSAVRRKEDIQVDASAPCELLPTRRAAPIAEGSLRCDIFPSRVWVGAAGGPGRTRTLLVQSPRAGTVLGGGGEAIRAFHDDLIGASRI